MLLRFCRSHLWNTSDHLSFMVLLLPPLFTDHSLPRWSFSSPDPPDPVTAQCSSWAPPHLQTGFKLLPVLSVPACLQSVLHSLCPYPHPFLIHHIYPTMWGGLGSEQGARSLFRAFCVPAPLPKMSSFPSPLQKSIPPCFIAFYLLTFPDLRVRMNSSFLIPWLFTYHNTCHSQSLIRVLSF